MSILQEYETIHKRIGEKKYNALEQYLQEQKNPNLFLSDIYYKESEWNKFENWFNKQHLNKTACISIQALYEKFGNKLTYTIIDKTGEGEHQYFDIYNLYDDMIACCDGECVQIIEENENVITFLNTDADKDIKFELSRKEFETAVFYAN